jgi:hypothetical protein
VSLVLVLWASALSITVEGNTSCPTPADVAARLQAVAPSSRMAGKALLTESEGTLRVQLVRTNGTVVGERVLDARYPCKELADAAAVVLASWQGEFDAAPVAAPSLEGVPVPPRPRGKALEFGVGLVAAGPRPLSAGGSLDLAGYMGNWGLRLHAMAVDFHREPVGAAEVSWNRSPLAVTVRRRFHFSTGLVLALDAGVAAAALFSRSGLLEMSQAYRALDIGPTGGAQLLFDAGRDLMPFLSISSAAWREVRILNVTATEYRVLPRADSWLVLGIVWRLNGS